MVHGADGLAALKAALAKHPSRGMPSVVKSPPSDRKEHKAHKAVVKAPPAKRHNAAVKASPTTCEESTALRQRRIMSKTAEITPPAMPPPPGPPRPCALKRQRDALGEHSKKVCCEEPPSVKVKSMLTFPEKAKPTPPPNPAPAQTIGWASVATKAQPTPPPPNPAPAQPTPPPEPKLAQPSPPTPQAQGPTQTTQDTKPTPPAQGQAQKPEGRIIPAPEVKPQPSICTAVAAGKAAQK